MIKLVLSQNFEYVLINVIIKLIKQKIFFEIKIENIINID